MFTFIFKPMFSISWPVGITLTLSAFALLILSLVVGSIRQSMDLVSTDYYEQEIQYQSVIEMKANTSQLENKISAKSSDSEILIEMPYELNTGSIVFFRPSDKDRDFSIDIHTDSKGIQSIPKKHLLPGLWTIKIQWEKDGKKYYDEKSLMI